LADTAKDIVVEFIDVHFTIAIGVRMPL